MIVKLAVLLLLLNFSHWDPIQPRRYQPPNQLQLPLQLLPLLCLVKNDLLPTHPAAAEPSQVQVGGHHSVAGHHRRKWVAAHRLHSNNRNNTA
jgi:hypothetical protein